MRGSRVSSLLPLAALLGPWIAGHSERQSHAPTIAILSLALALAAILRASRRRAEQLVLFVVLFLSWPAALVAVAHAVLGLDRAALAGSATLLLAGALLARLLATRRTLAPDQRCATTLLERAFPDIVPLARAELGLLWFGLFRWRRNASDAPTDAVAFPGTASGTEVAMCLLTAAGFVIETPLLHLLLRHVANAPVAWICTGLHGLLGIYLVGYAKSLLWRPTLLFGDRIEIRLGVIARRVVPRAAIGTVTAHNVEKAARAEDFRLYGFDEPNIRLCAEGVGVLFRVDDPKRLLHALAA